MTGPKDQLLAKDGTVYSPALAAWTLLDTGYYYDGPLCGTVQVEGQTAWFFAVNDASGEGWRIFEVRALTPEEIQHELAQCSRNVKDRDAPVPYDQKYAHRPVLGYFND